jgi:hypothetical protein
VREEEEELEMPKKEEEEDHQSMILHERVRDRKQGQTEIENEVTGKNK